MGWKFTWYIATYNIYKKNYGVKLIRISTRLSWKCLFTKHLSKKKLNTKWNFEIKTRNNAFFHWKIIRDRIGKEWKLRHWGSAEKGDLSEELKSRISSTISTVVCADGSTWWRLTQTLVERPDESTSNDHGHDSLSHGLTRRCIR